MLRFPQSDRRDGLSRKYVPRGEEATVDHPLIRQRFWENVEHADECWWWIGPTVSSGYGKIRVGNETRLAHRVAWEMFLGESIPTGMQILHKCDNPLCVRPGHLFMGTAEDNMQDKVAKGRAKTHNSYKTRCKYGHPFSPENTLVDGNGYRHCRECGRRRMEEFRAKKNI